MSSYVEELSGIVALPDVMNGSLLTFARRIRVTIEREQAKLNPDNALIALLCDAARLGWEFLEMVKNWHPRIEEAQDERE